MGSKTTRRTMHLTKDRIDRLRTDKRSGEEWFDDELHGFAVRVWPSGRKTFILLYGPRNRRRRFKVGVYGDMTADRARKVARRLAGEIEAGTDPQDRKEAQRVARTVAEWTAEYLEEVSRRKRSARDDVRYLGEAAALWGPRKLAEVTAEDVKREFEAAQKRGRTTANRWLASVRACIQEAWRLGLVEENVARRVRPLPEAPPRARVLTDEELGRLAKAIDGMDDPHVRAAFIVLLETGCRQSEILRATWDDFDLRDLDSATWRVPRPKSGRATVKPLTRPTAELITGLPRVSRHVIAGRDPFKPRADLKRHWYRLIAEAKVAGVRLHDLRRSFGLEVARRVGLHMASKLLGHSDVRITAQVYSPFNLDEQRDAAEKVRAARGKVLKFRKVQGEEEK